ncbi:MAG: T9SS type A sorting domain-containing protein [Flavobacteriales bacterium]|nr:T9SS type A sorting domain-containing protein [Flavobacteriales bacterium]
MIRPLAVIIALTWPLVQSAQVIAFDNGTLTIDQGTTVRVSGPATWVLGPASTVLNDGLIDLGSEAVLNEPDGRPITGSGFERSAPLAGSVQPANGIGGLGLIIMQMLPLPSITVTRGHLPREHADYGLGIARWFVVEGLEQTSPPVTLVMKYDQTELNSLAEPLLELHASVSEMGPWAEATSTHDQSANTFTGDLPSGTNFTAFAVDPQGRPSLHVKPAELQVWPSLTDGPLTIMFPTGDVITDLWIFDSSGRMVLTKQFAALTGAMSLDLEALAPGAYVLRTDSGSAARFVRR